MNIIQIVSDSFRHDFLGCYGNRWIHTPNLDDFAQKATIFDSAYTASFPTVPHRHDIYTGRYTFTYSEWAPLPRDEVILPQLLRQAGYVTQLIVDTYNMMSMGYDRGFDGWWWNRGQEADRYMTAPRKVVIPCDLNKVRLGEAFFTQYLRNVSLRRFEQDYFVAQTMTAAAKWLELNYDQHDKFFLHIDTFDPHEPWDPPKYYVDMYNPDYEGEIVNSPKYGPCEYLTPKELNHCRALYAGEATMVDRWVGMLLKKIEDLGLLRNTAVIFTSDHGYYFGEHGLIGKFYETPPGSLALYEEVAHIPVIIYLPDAEGGRRRRELVQPPDLTATVLELSEVNKPNEIQGESLVPLLRGKDRSWRDFAVTSPSLIRAPTQGQRITVTTHEWAFIYSGQIEDALRDNPGKRTSFERLESNIGKIKNELYNLAHDPKQQHNVLDEQKETAKQLHSELLNFLRELKTREDYLKYWKNLE